MNSNLNTVKELKKIWSVEKKKNNTYCLKKYKGKDSKVVIPGYIGKVKVTEIDSNCFPHNNDFIEEIDVNENIEIINSLYGFQNLKKLNFHRIPKKIGSIYALGNTIESFGIFGETIYFKNRLIAVSKNVNSDFVVEDGTIEISQGAFKDCTRIKNVKLPESLKVIKHSAFIFCSNLESINLENVEVIKEWAFCGCEKLNNIDLQQLKELDPITFSGSGIRNVTIPGINKIPYKSFSSCSNLTSVILNEGTTIIGNSAFMDCDKLTKVYLPKTLVTIEDSAFISCPNISDINLSNGVETFTYSFNSEILEKLKPISKSNNICCSYNIERLLKETKKMQKREIKIYIEDLLKDHKLDNFDSSKITDMNNIAFDSKTGELTWKCHTHGYCTCDLWDLLAEEGKMISNFDFCGCGFCRCR